MQFQVASGKLRKDKDGNWEFEYDSPVGSESSDEDDLRTAKPPSSAGNAENPQIPEEIGVPGETLNLVSYLFLLPHSSQFCLALLRCKFHTCIGAF